MAKFRLPSGAGTKKIALRDGGDVVVLRFTKKGEAKCAEKYVELVKSRCPNLELLEEEVETE